MPRQRAEVTVETADIVFEHQGKQYTAKVYPDGSLALVGNYRGERIYSYSTLGRIREAMNRLDADVEAKKVRVKRLAEAAKEPEPALYLADGSLAPPKQVGVRGIDQRSGSALITHTDGTKAQTRRKDVLRVLNEGELADLTAAQRRVRLCREALDALKAIDLYDIEDEELPSLTARFDTERDGWVAEFEGEELFTQGRPQYDLPEMVRLRLVRRRFPIAAVSKGNGRVELHAVADVPDDELKRADYFASKEDAEAYYAAKDAVCEAVDALLAVRQDFVFDFTPFEAEES